MGARSRRMKSKKKTNEYAATRWMPVALPVTTVPVYLLQWAVFKPDEVR
jgi:hypothetical protein